MKKTILLTTHIKHVANVVFDKVALIKNGKKSSISIQQKI